MAKKVSEEKKATTTKSKKEVAKGEVLKRFYCMEQKETFNQKQVYISYKKRVLDLIDKGYLKLVSIENE